MSFIDAINSRHSVRQYTDKPIEDELRIKLSKFIDLCNKDSGLNMQLVFNEPKAFNCALAKYGKFIGVNNYLAIIGDKSKKIYPKIGYYGEKFVLFTQDLGLNTCWVALTYKKIKDKVCISKKEKIHLVIAIGYGKTQGNTRKSKTIYKVSDANNDSPKWYIDGLNSALLAPTAMNQQKFFFTLKDKKVKLKAGKGFYSKLDLGIVKLHFEEGAGRGNFEWDN